MTLQPKTREQMLERHLESWLATAIAKDLLQLGDRLYIARCGGIRSTVTFVGWDGRWIETPSLNDVHATHILRINKVKRNLWHEAQAIIRNLPKEIRAGMVEGMRCREERIDRELQEEQARRRKQIAEDICDEEVPF